MRRVNCVRKRGDHYPPHERIQGLAGLGWYHTEEAAIDNIESGRESYYTVIDGIATDLVVATHQGRKYLKTEHDGDAPDKLLGLQGCP